METIAVYLEVLDSTVLLRLNVSVSPEKEHECFQNVAGHLLTYITHHSAFEKTNYSYLEIGCS